MIGGMGGSPSFDLRALDQEFFTRELDSFVPDEIFDAHLHLGRRSDYHQHHAALVANVPECADMATYRSHLPWLLPGRHLAGALAIPTTLHGEDLDRGNRFASEQAHELPGGASAVVVSPTMTEEQAAAEVERNRAAALKCYHLMSARTPTMDSALEEYLPDHLVSVANDAELAIILHLVRKDGVADAGNIDSIRRLCLRFPRMRLVLAHAARGYNPSHTMRAIDDLAGLDNLFFDTSCVTEAGAFTAILQTYGTSRLMWGSDYPFSHMRGRCIAVADNFAWLYDCHLDPARFSPDKELQFTLVGLESLRMLQHACIAGDLRDADLEALFCTSAQVVFGHDG